MKTIRSNIFETNSSSTHSVVLCPIDIKMINDMRSGRYICDSVPFCEEKKMLVLDKNPGITFGTFETFYEKLNYIVCLLLYRHRDELYDTNERSWDDYTFNISNANNILQKHYKEFCTKIAEYVSNRYKVDCKTIGYLPSPGKGGKTGDFDFDHEVLSDTSEPNLALGEDLFTIITTEGLAIKYSFA